jgi:TonB family protein
MGAYFAYSLQSAICLAVFYLFYKVLLSRETFHRFNRLALLSILSLSVLTPVIATFVSPAKTAFAQADLTDKERIDAEISSISAEIIAPKDNGAGSKSNLLPLLLIVYLTGFVTCLIYMAVSNIRIIRIIRKGKHVATINGITIVTHDKGIPSFSWMKYIALSQADYDEAGETIIMHENAHIRLHHTCDLVFAQFCIVVQWFNPAAWLLYKELHDIHEYQADEEVTLQGVNACQYQLLIIKKAVGARLYSIANSFNHSNLKKRIAMMLQKKSNSWTRLKYAFVLPLAATAVAAFARPEISHYFEEISNAKVSHFALKTSTNEVKNFPETKIPENLSNDPGIEFTRIQSPSETTPSDTDFVFIEAEVMPKFPGGDIALLKFIANHINYPASAKGIQGRVFCEFTVEKDGSVSDIKVVKSLDPELDVEAVRVLGLLPKFIPGKHRGITVRVKYSVPVSFILQ